MTKDVNTSLPKVTEDLCRKVLNACEACADKTADVFTTNLRRKGVQGWEIAALVREFFADLAEDARLSIEALIMRIEVALPFLGAEQQAA